MAAIEPKLARLARGCSAFLLARAVLRDAALGSLVAAAAVLAVALLAPGAPRLPLLALLAAGPLVGLGRWLRRRPPLADRVLYIDRRLGAESAIVTAASLGDDVDREGPIRATLEAAAATLARARLRDVRPRVVGRSLWAFAPAAIALAVGLWLPAAAPAAPRSPGQERVRTTRAEALTKLERFAEQEVEDPAQRERLEAIAERAAELRSKLAEGALEQREALDQVAELEERVERELGRESAAQRRARDRAIEALAEAGEQGLADALADRDLAALSREAGRAAARREAADRERARQALDAAARAASGDGAAESGLGEVLEAESRRLARHGEQAALARELLEAMPELEGVGRGLERLERDGEGGELDAALAAAMREAWSRLSPEERERLARALRDAPVEGSGQPQGDGGTEGRPLSADEIEAQLREALANLDDLRLQLGGGAGAGLPLPSPGQGGQGGQGGSQAGSQGSPSPGGQPGGDGTGSGGHIAAAGSTQQVAGAGDLLVRVRPTPGQGPPTPTSVEWVDPQGTALPPEPGAAAPPGISVEGSAGAIERPPIPEEYEEHVRSYFGGSGRQGR